MASSSSSSFVPRKGWTYDVFLSFRGDDTRNNFVDHLYDALTRKGIQTFKDDKMVGGGQRISEELVKAIKESRFAVVVFSNNYANSSWCLEELSKIMECHDTIGLKVLPVFYHVHPSDVRRQTGDFATAFKTYENKFKGEMDKVKKWREALTAASSLSGQHILPEHGGEVSFISKIVQEILADKQPRGGNREKHLIGMEPRIRSLISLLKMKATKEVRIVGICGMGGLGKTTIARALFNRIAYKFDGSSFVKDIRENSKKNICGLQEKILKDILGARHEFKIEDPGDGAEMIQERCCNKKVLLVLDDVDDDKQLDFLAAERESFGPGSRIIITTRDQHVLSYANADDMYKPALLRTDQALELFSRHAFRKSSPPNGYMDLSKRAIDYTHCFPLALKVVGSFLRGREVSVWESALDRLAKTPSDEVLDTLKLSFDYLSVLEKKIFLDIACFYKGRDVDDVSRILDSFGFDPVIGISVLIEKSLIDVSSNNMLDMHDLIQEMGWKVVQESVPDSRVWQHENIQDFINKRELKLIEGIVVPWRENVDLEFNMSVDVFRRMKNLRVLDCFLNFTCRKPTFLPDELRWFCWYGYPFSSLPVSHMRKLVGLEMENGRIEHLWKGEKMMLQNLKFVHLKSCSSLTRFPNVSGAPNIESINLSGCSGMEEVDKSVGSLKKLLHLDMSHCYELKSLPSMLHMESLETLILSYCWSLKRIPEFSPCMVNLYHLDFSSSFEIEEVPSSIKFLSNLSGLNLDQCKSLKNIPSSICELRCLTRLGLSSCEELRKLPFEFKSIEFLEELHIDFIHFHALTNLSSLRKLYLFGEIEANDFPKNLHGISSLEELHIELNYSLTQLPESISHLTGLKHLQFETCRRLQTIHGLPSRIQVLIANNCRSLKKIEDLAKKYECLHKIWISDCQKLIKDEESERYLDKILKRSFLEKCAAVDGCLNISIGKSNIPSWFKAQHNGRQIALKLPPRWQTKIAGFAIYLVSRGLLRVGEMSFGEIRLRFEYDGILVTEPKAHNIYEREEDTNVNMWIGYIPFSLFEKLHEESNNDWFDMTEGYLVFEFLNHHGDVERCGAQVVYKEDVASIQQTIPSISSYYASWKLTESNNCIVCEW